jgi:hypothetical protein
MEELIGGPLFYFDLQSLSLLSMVASPSPSTLLFQLKLLGRGELSNVDSANRKGKFASFNKWKNSQTKRESLELT